jgi:hypothetical protein
MVKNDDGEAGAGMIILRMLEREGLGDHIDVVTVWFGGKHLGCGRFRHVQEAIRIYIRALWAAKSHRLSLLQAMRFVLGSLPPDTPVKPAPHVGGSQSAVEGLFSISE